MKIRGFIITGTILAALGIGITAYAATRDDFSMDMFNDPNVEIENVEYTKEETDKVNAISFTSFADGLVIVPSDTDQIKMDVKSTSRYYYDYSIDEENNTLVINQVKKDNHKVFPFDFGSNKVFTIYVPKELDLTVDISAGGLDVEEVGLNKVNLTVDAGGAKLNNSTINDLYAKVDAGGLELNNCTVGKIEGKVDAGGAKLNNSTINDLSAKVNAGGLKLNNCTVGKIEGKVNAGGLDFSGKITDSGKFNVSAGGLELELIDNKDNYTINGVGSGPVNITYEVSAGGKDISFKN